MTFIMETNYYLCMYVQIIQYYILALRKDLKKGRMNQKHLSETAKLLATTIVVKKDKIKQIDEYLEDIRPSNSSDPNVHPKWSVCQWIWYCICFVMEIPLIMVLETISFLLTGFGFWKAIRAHKAINNRKDAADSIENGDGLRKLQSISIIIPCYNEAANIEQLLLYIEKHCNYKSNVEIILIDGNSDDKWYENLMKNKKLLNLLTIPFRIIYFEQHKQSGRGICQNIAAKEYAKNDILIFLHADCIVCKDFDEIARNKINSDKYLLIGSWGYRVDCGKMKYPLPGFSILQFRANLKSSLFLVPWGDHGYFMTKHIFNNVLGGFANQSIMEDYHFANNARKYALLNNKNIFVGRNNYFYTSPRKWYESGRIWKRTIRNQYIVFLYEYLKYEPQQIYQMYYGCELPQ